MAGVVAFGRMGQRPTRKGHQITLAGHQFYEDFLSFETQLGTLVRTGVFIGLGIATKVDQ